MSGCTPRSSSSVYRRNAAARLLATNRSGRIGMVSARPRALRAEHDRGRGPGSRPRGRLRRVRGGRAGAGPRRRSPRRRQPPAGPGRRGDRGRGGPPRRAQPGEVAVAADPDRARPGCRAGGEHGGGHRPGRGRSASPRSHLLDAPATARWRTSAARPTGPRRCSGGRGGASRTRRAGRSPGPEAPGSRLSASSGYDAGLRIAQDPSVTRLSSSPTTRWRSACSRRCTRPAATCPGTSVWWASNNIPEAGFYFPSLTTVAQDEPRARPPGGRPDGAGPRRRGAAGRRARAARAVDPLVHGAATPALRPHRC